MFNKKEDIIGERTYEPRTGLFTYEFFSGDLVAAYTTDIKVEPQFAIDFWLADILEKINKEKT